MDIAALVVSIVALFVAALAAWFAGRQARASEASAEIQRQQHAATLYRFRLVHVSGAMYHLRNFGTGTVYNVHAALIGGYVIGQAKERDSERLLPGEVLEFKISTPTQSKVVVEWDPTPEANMPREVRHVVPERQSSGG